MAAPLELLELAASAATPASVLYALWRIDRRLVRLETLVAALVGRAGPGPRMVRLPRARSDTP